MIKITTKQHIGICIAALMLIFCTASTASASGRTIYLDQGWTENERQDFYTTPQGSYLIPLRWYLALETAHGLKLFASRRHIRKFNYLFDDDSSDDNTNSQLPVGFAIETVADGDDWLGMTCAACHTNEIVANDVKIRLEGGPTLADFNGFVKSLHDAVKATLDNRPKFFRFALRVLGFGHWDQFDELYQALKDYEPQLGGFVTRNIDTTGIEYGYARLDAFGAIMNEVFGDDLHYPGNINPANAPVSYPHLWGTPRHDWVQWNGSANNPLGRNVGEVLGVFGSVDLIDPAQFGNTSARGEELIYLEQLVGKLTAPKWPEEYLGSIDLESAERGYAIYTEFRGDEPSCAYCHALRDANGNYPMTPAEENLFGVQFVETKMTPLEEIGTDPAMAMNFATRVVSTAHLAPLLPSPFTGAAELPAPVLLSVLVGSATQNALGNIQPPLSDAEVAAAIGYRIKAPGLPPYTPKNLLAYRAAPLEGVWATAPYLHNGSVQNLYELLLPASERQSSFFVGSRRFDPVKVGFKSVDRKRTSLLDTTLPGNSNLGHEYGVTLSTEQKLDLIEFLKTL
ncbi:MAG: di-heme-cytochrome C peroxidase [Gammaproteobacteria bacterium]|jgi:hypothetical protein